MGRVVETPFGAVTGRLAVNVAVGQDPDGQARPVLLHAAPVVVRQGPLVSPTSEGLAGDLVVRPWEAIVPGTHVVAQVVAGQVEMGHAVRRRGRPPVVREIP